MRNCTIRIVEFENKGEEARKNKNKLRMMKNCIGIKMLFINKFFT